MSKIKRKHLTTKNTSKRKDLRVPEYDKYRCDFDRELDNFSDFYSAQIRHNWKTIGVIGLSSKIKSSGEKFPHSLKYFSEMFKKYGSRGRFFHLTSPLNASKILNVGLKGEGVRKNTSMGCVGEIYLVESDSEKIWNYIGISQLGMGLNGLPFDVLEIDVNGIYGEMFSENCNDYPSPLHTMVKQNIIEAKWIKKVSEFKTSRIKYYEDRSELGNLKLEYLQNHYPHSNTISKNSVIEGRYLKAA